MEPINDCITKVIYSNTEDDSDNSTIPSYLVGGLDLVLYSDDDDDEDDSDNSTIPSYLVDGLDLDLHSDDDWDSEEDEDEEDQTTKLNVQ